MNQYLKNIQDLLQQNKTLSDADKEALLKTIADADKQWSITDFKLDRTEKVKKTTAILLEETIVELEQKRKAVEAQNKELEIESSLERVRAVAMGMNKPDDLLGICETLFKELQKLGFSELRNSMINIHNDEKGSFLNYDFSDFAGAVIANVDYNIYPSVQILVKQSRNFKDAFIEYVYSGQELKDWKEFRKKNGEYDDPRVENITSLYYYFYSIGIGSIGISAFNAIGAERLELLKRFRNVFDLAYRRYTDITKAEAQARESQIQLALERVRARTMAMQKSEELPETSHILFEQMKELGEPVEQLTIGVVQEENNVIEISATLHGDILKKIYQHSIDEPFMMSKIYHAWKTQQKTLIIELKSDELNAYNKYRNELTKSEMFPTNLGDEHRRIVSAAFFSKGMLALGANEPRPPESLQMLERFAGVFDQAYTRFLDLQKAEAQAREAQIEAALERVRSRTMAMQRSDELSEAATVLFQQVKALGISQWTCGFNIWEPGDKEFTFYPGSPDGDILPPCKNIPLTEDPVFILFDESRKRGDELCVYESKGEIQEAHYRYMLTVPGGLGAFLQTLLDHGVQFPTFQIDHIANFSQGNLLFITYEHFPEMHDIFKRFAKVFEQTYTRFLDLQKAEAQAREAKIETSLERVRAHAMAMHNSQDLSQTVNVFFKELKNLGITPMRCGVGEMNDKTQTSDLVFTTADKQGELYELPGKLKHEGHPVIENIYNYWKIQKEYHPVLQGADINAYYQVIKSQMVLPDFPEYTRHYGNYFYFKEGFFFAWGDTEFTEEGLNICRRFTSVLSLTYKRYKDLKQAEASAREAQIEVSLERVRSKAMAMQKSEDLANAVAIVFEELGKLNLGMLRCGIGILNKEKRSADVWTTTKSDNDTVVQVSGDESMDIHPLLQGAFEAWLNQEDHSYVLKGEDLNDYYKAVAETNFKLPDSQSLITGSEGVQQFYFNAVFSSGGLFAFRETEFPEEAKIVLKRFADVFNLTYTRFNDLKQAEAQAREARIEAAMEKVRARAMAMQKPGELVEVAQVLRKEMGLLGVEELETSSIYIHDEVAGTTECWYAIQDIRGQDKKLITDYMTIRLHDTWVGREMMKFYTSGQKQTSILMQGENRKEWINYCARHSKVFQGYYGDTIPERTYHLLKFSNGYMGAASPGNISAESWELLKRATSVFSLAYTRFSDLQIAEANAKEAVKQSALDRIRADIASMRTINDLDRITPLIWNELTILGIPFTRCGVFIMDDAQQLIHTFLSTPDGKAIAAFHIPYDTPGNIRQVLSHWQDKKNYIDHWDEVAFTEFAGTLAKQGVLESPEQYLKTIPHGGFYLHFLPFLQGMLYAGNSTRLGEEEINLVQSVADAFSTAYARYEDFNKLEAAKQQVDKTLAELKQAQTQLVQSEKMASLGELTAGIAHEIQNPLNFVNNFSEVSNELLEEMKDELAKGNYKDAIAIANDVMQNLEKINHHGKRADGIVKGMLQHSRTSSGQKELTDINILADEYLRLCYHGLRAKDKSFNAVIQTDFDKTLSADKEGNGKINIIPQDIGRVILNLLTNAFYAVSEKNKEHRKGYEPTVSLYTKKEGDKILISVKDNGNGVPQKVLDKIFQPFFTTKPTGQGTGLGLSLSYDIIKGHGGEINVETKEGEGTTFIISIPINN